MSLFHVLSPFVESDSILNLHINKKKKTQSKGILEIMEEKLTYEAKARIAELEIRREQMKFDCDMQQRHMELEERRMHLQEAQQLEEEKCQRE